MMQSAELIADDAWDASASPDRILGPLAGLLIARWASHDESEREAIAAFDEEVFSPELPEALRRSAWDDPTRNHASQVAAALGAMATRNDAGSAAVRHVGRVAPLVMHAVEGSPSTYERLYARVRQIDFTKPGGRTLAARLFDDVLRTIMARQGNRVGEFVTPNEVATLMLELADPQPGDRVYDPCFGFGELLVGAARRLREAARTAPPRVWAGIRQTGIFGIEINRLSHAVGLCRILLAGIDRPGLELSDALERPLPRSRSGDGFDCIMAVPPWGMRVSRTSAVRFPFPSRHSETLFLQHVMANLRPGGRAVVALPEGPLRRPGPDRRMRKALLSDYSVDAVVSLPAGAFAPWTGVPVSLVVFRRDEPRLSVVRFISIPPDTWNTAAEVRDNDIRDGRDSDPQGLGIGTDGPRDGSEFESVADPDAGLAAGGGIEGGSGWGAGRDGGSGFGGGIGAGAAFGDGSGFGSGEGSGVGLGDGGGHSDRTDSDAGFEDGTGFGHEAGLSVASDGGVGGGDGRTRPADLFRCATDLSRRRSGVPADAFPFRVETWDVPVRELAVRDHELIARESGSDALDAEIDRLAAADPSLRIERLDHVADAFVGQSYGRRYITRGRCKNDAAAALVRAADIEDIADTTDAVGNAARRASVDQVRTPPRFLTAEGKARVKEKEYLHPSDVVVSTRGITGKVAFYPIPLASTELHGTEGSTVDTDSAMQEIADSFIPLVATSSVAVLRARRGLIPGFLACLLRAPVYQAWLSGHVRGTNIPRLSIRVLRRLRIPVPPVPVQEVVLKELPRLRGDAMAVLVRLLSSAASDPVTSWLDTPFVARLASGSTRGTDHSDKFGGLVTTTGALGSLVVRVNGRSDRTSSVNGDRRVDGWLDVARQVAMTLDGVESIPRGAGRLAILEVALSRLNEALRVLEGAEGSVVDRLRSFTRAMVESAEGEVRAMQESIRLDIALEPAEVPVGAVSEVELRVTNASAVPLRSLHVSTRPPVGTGQLPYLADGETHHFPLAVHPRDATRLLRIAVSLRARRIDGAPAVDREVEVFLRVLSTREAVRAGDLGVSPYIVGNPVDRREMFFGRTDDMERIKRQVGANSQANVILLEGNRRTGKTSILRQIGKADVLPGWIPVYCSFQEAEGDSSKSGVTTRNVFRLLVRTTGWALYDAGIETWLPGLPDRDPERPFKRAFMAALNQAFVGEHPFEVFELYIEAALEAANPRRILLMLDEFDKLQEGIDAGITSPQVPENIRHLLQHQSGLSAIITGSRRLKRLREEYWSALFGLGYRIGIGALPIDEARRLVTEPVEGRLDYLPQARDGVVELCAKHPFLIQSLCNRVFEQAASGGGPTITLDTVERAATEMVCDNEHFRTLWDYAGSARRRFLLALCDRFSEGPDPVNLDFLEMKLRENEVSLRRASELVDDIDELRELELLDFDGSYRGGTYRLSVPLMANWLQMNVEFGDLVARARQETMEVER